VISGLPELISKAVAHFESKDAQCHPLNVSAAFHSRYMKPAADDFLEYLRKVNFLPLRIPVISNVSARPYDESESSLNLVSQIYSSVKWQESIQYMMAMGVDTFVEIGPGNVLTNMQKNISPDPSLELPDREVDSGIEIKSQNAKIKRSSNRAIEQVSNWNNRHPIGVKIKLKESGENYKTRSKAMLLFGDKAAIYLQGKKGFFPLADISSVS